MHEKKKVNVYVWSVKRRKKFKEESENMQKREMEKIGDARECCDMCETHYDLRCLNGTLGI